MAIEYRLYMAAPATSEVLAEQAVALGREGGILDHHGVQDLLGDGGVLSAGMWCRVTPARLPRPFPDALEEEFGIVHTCWIVFREDGSHDRFRQRDQMVWMVGGLLGRLPADAALHYQYEVLWLVRKGGRLVVNERDDIWTAERLAFLPQPFERAALAFAED